MFTLAMRVFVVVMTLLIVVRLLRQIVRCAPASRSSGAAQRSSFDDR